MYDGSMETFECIWVNIWFMLDCISNQRSDMDWMERYQIVKARACFRGLLSKIFRSLSQFFEIETRGWPKEVLHMAKTKTIRR